VEALRTGGGAPAVLNGANEEVVAGYLNGKFPFLVITDILSQVMKELDKAASRPDAPPWLRQVGSIQDAIAADGWGRQAAAAVIRSKNTIP
ncbi:MAG: 1-deoxy-D-xylulose-5-phosphate reductoisomerase, partial [Deltaproteobacteria bacterium]|nr:1-deoxy-D-xylulose-5-phosphate reductoisomerase [Deltaproteobacteria bacterium]